MRMKPINWETSQQDLGAKGHCVGARIFDGLLSLAGKCSEEVLITHGFVQKSLT